MISFDLILLNLTSPSILAFFLGMAAALMKSNLRVPPQVHEVISQYLLFAIGLKGGFALMETELDVIMKPAIATFAIGVIITFIAFAFARLRYDLTNACALCAHYGSVSAVTFIACLSFIRIQGGTPENYLTALLAILEIPAILIGLIIYSQYNSAAKVPFAKVAAEVLSGKTMLLLIGGIIIGMIAGESGKALVEPVFITPFQGMLVFFLLEMGIVAAEHLRSIKKRDTAFIVLFGIVMALTGGLIGAAAGNWAGMSETGMLVLATMGASASYIAAPAAIRMSIPDANPGVYLVASIGITLPFNLIIGIPLYQEWFVRGLFV